MLLARTTPNRRGFTLVELLVAAGLSMLIMVMVTSAFQRGMDVLSELKSIGEMQQRARAFETIVRSDLEADHFDSKYGPKVSDQRLDKLAATGLTNDNVTWRPPVKGFFSLRQGSGSVVEGTDSDGVRSTRATDHILHMTVRRDATRGDKIFNAGLPASIAAMPAVQQMNMSQMAFNSNTFSSPWAEVAYFLDTSNQLGRTPGGTPLYGLYRRVRVLADAGTPASMSWNTVMTSMSSNSDRAASQSVSFAPRTVNTINRPMNGPAEIRNPQNRLGGITANRTLGSHYDRLARERDGDPVDATGGNATGTDLLLTDVLSFEIKADWDGGTVAPGSNTHQLMNLFTTYEYPFSDLPLAAHPFTGYTAALAPRNPLMGLARVYDTWYDTASGSWLAPVTAGGTTITEDVVPQPMRLRAVQIKVRVWDRKNNLARQVTIISAL